jgi:hypothetical protein
MDETKLLAYYDELMNEFFNTHHVHSSNLPNIELSDEVIAQMGELDGMSQNLLRSLAKQSKRKSKKVIFHSNPDYCNGLPRRRR